MMPTLHEMLQRSATVKPFRYCIRQGWIHLCGACWAFTRTWSMA